MPTNLAVWQEIERMFANGLSVIPVRDKADGKFAAKTPYKEWKKYQSEYMHKEVLHRMMEDYNTNAVAIVCGKISGNLEVIDIDSKYEPGIDAIIFDTIKSLYPDLWHILRIHRTPSGGFHILYRITSPQVPGNQKLACRETTEAEREATPAGKKPATQVAFIETRGEGGYVLAPPAFGYTVHKDCEVPGITWEDRCALINICKSFSKIIEKPKQQPKQSKRDESFYEESPFDHYNRSGNALDILIQSGWQIISEKAGKIWLNKPGGKKGAVHAAYFTDNNLFYVFTTATDFESEKAYNQCATVAHLLFDNDYKKLYRWLVENKYGHIRNSIEEDMVRKGKALPPNASPEARQKIDQKLSTEEQQYPHGKFWLYDEKDKLYISREHLYTVAEGLGYRLYRDEIYQIRAPFIYSITSREFFDGLKNYIKEEDGDLYMEICNTYESFIQKSGEFTITRIKQLTDDEYIKDTRETCNKFYQNGYLRITGDQITLLPYETLGGALVFHNRVLNRPYNPAPPEPGAYTRFLSLAIGDITDNVRNTIGYLAHEFKDETTAYIVVCVEKCLDPKNGGGSGKNIFCQMFENTTTFKARPGSGAKFDEKFFQAWNGEKIFCISDVDKNFNFIFLKEPAGGNITWKRLWKNEESVSPKDAPKLIVQTNYSYEISDGGLKRRVIPIEFTDYFTINGGVKQVLGKHFANDFTEADWADYDNFIAECVKGWLRSGRVLKADALSETGWEKQFTLTHGQTIHEIVTTFWDRWLKMEFVSDEDFKIMLEEFYNSSGISFNYRPSMIKLNKALAEYAAKNKMFFKKDHVKNIMGASKKGKLFGETSLEPAPF